MPTQPYLDFRVDHIWRIPDKRETMWYIGDANPAILVQRLSSRCRGGGDWGTAGYLDGGDGDRNWWTCNNFEFQGVLDVFRVFKLARILKLARYLCYLYSKDQWSTTSSGIRVDFNRSSTPWSKVVPNLLFWGWFSPYPASSSPGSPWWWWWSWCWGWCWRWSLWSGHIMLMICY